MGWLRRASGRLPTRRPPAGGGRAAERAGAGAGRATGLRRGCDGVATASRPRAEGVLAVGTGLMIAAFEFASLPAVVGLALLGAVVAAFSYRALTPSGTTRAARGLLAGIAMRRLLSAAYFGADTFLPLGPTELRGLGTIEAGPGRSAGAPTWVAGSALRARWDDRCGARLRPTYSALGTVVLCVGIVVSTATILIDAVPPLVAVAGWAIGGFGMGVAYHAASAAVVAQGPDEQQGRTGAALQLSQTFAVAVLGGLGGGAVALSHAHGAGLGTALGVTFGRTALLAPVAIPVSRRIKVPPAH
ncbi:hypothetical protein [Embleya sp. AB8]|uniref:hypothetical protein n=1 Tax=Embleya sp. AB8 TaxID=3156304 RepID=UPI003C7194AC